MRSTGRAKGTGRRRRLAIRSPTATGSTINGDDRCRTCAGAALERAPGVVKRRHRRQPSPGTEGIFVAEALPRGPAALQRLERDVFTLSGRQGVIWLEGINDFQQERQRRKPMPRSPAMREGVARIRAADSGVKVIGATLTSALGSTNAAHGCDLQDEKRRKLNDFGARAAYSTAWRISTAPRRTRRPAA